MKKLNHSVRRSRRETKVISQPFLLPGHHLQFSEFESWQHRYSHMVGKVGRATIARDKLFKSISDIEVALLIAKEKREAGRPTDELLRKKIEVPKWTHEREK